MNGSTNHVKLTVRTSDAASEHIILNGKFNRVGANVGNETVFNLPQGLYTVKVKVGSGCVEKHVTLRKDEIVNFDPITFSTPVPLEVDEDRARVVQNNSKKQQPDVQLGEGSRLFLFGSTDKSFGDSIPEQRVDPAIGLTLRNSEDEILIDFAQPHVGTYGGDGKPWAACDVEIRPGIYTLCLQTASGNIFKLNIITSPGWQTQVFLQLRNYGIKERDIRADLGASAILMARIGQGFEVKSAHGEQQENYFRLIEQVRLALVNGRNVIGKGLMASLFSGKFENPMFGIYAAHLLLLSPDFQFTELKNVVGKLRGILGNAHPDVEAIALKIGMESNYVFRHFPMLANSWSFILERSVTNTDLVPVDSVAYINSGHFWNSNLWLVWGNAVNGSNADVRANFKNLIEIDEKKNKKGKILGTISSVVRGLASNETVKKSLLNHLPKHHSALVRALTSLTDDRIVSIAKQFGIPANKVIDILKSMHYEDIVEIVRKVNIQSSPDRSNDPQKAKWGEKPERNGRRMTAAVMPSAIPGLYVVTITVNSIRVDIPLKGEVKFHLHDTFLNPNPIVPVIDGRAELKLNGVWGSFTVGAEADAGETILELDLAELPGITQEFRDR